ncbi:staphylococcal nuclease domain-containing 1-like [Brachionus plicatilis]|uniref:Staphylococcal nuclease domain-containing protein 1 n=1 Tax=Brachionus plicatilis TaxID=10195 RepID=A0A3M7RNR9_BRAPC|nr:staphylococcal nuclease domain-containing 1-like [Brachionus plicatilis]
MAANSQKPQAASAAASPQLYRGIVKQVTSGDCVVIKSLGSKSLEKTLMLSGITAPRLGRRLSPNSAESVIESDQPYAFEAREFLRKKLVGKEVCFVRDANAQNVDRGVLFLGREPSTAENMNEAMVSAGLAEVRRLNKPTDTEAALVALEDQAKAKNLGKWSKEPDTEHIRDIKYTLENPGAFVDSFAQKPQDAIVEFVRDGSTLRLLLLPSYNLVSVQLSGVKCPGFKREADQEQAEPFADEAKLFVESRLLHRDVKVVLEGVSNKSNAILLGTVLHPAGNISEYLLKEGLAKCVDWSMGNVTSGTQKYRDAEKSAKAAKLRLWKNYAEPKSGDGDEPNRKMSGKVVEIGNGDSLVLKLSDGTLKKVFLSSIRAPRIADFAELTPKVDKKANQLYDVPYMFEAREFLRKKLIGKKVNLTVDYVQPKSNDYAEKVCCTVMLAETNVAEALVSQGLAKVVRYKQEDNQRSSRYDDLLSAETRAEKKKIGVHSTKEPTTMRVADVSTDLNKAKQFLPFLQRSGKMDALVEYISSGSRFKLYLPKETCVITLLLSSIDCPRMPRPPANGTAAAAAAVAEEFAQDAFMYSKSHCMHHEVRVEVESIDKVGNFIGQITTLDGLNIAVGLVEQGFAAVYKSQSTSAALYSLLSGAELKAKERRVGRWKNYVEEKVVSDEAEKSEPQERVINNKKVVVTEVTGDFHFYAQLVENGPKLEQLTVQLRAELDARPPVPGAYTAKVGELCAAKFSMDDEWYRAKVLSVQSNGTVNVLFIDYGNRESAKSTSLAQLPAGFEALPAQAHEYALAMVQLSADEDDNELALDQFRELVLADPDAEFSVNVEYKVANLEYVSLYDVKNDDIGKRMVAEGYVSVDKSRKERRLHKLVQEYLKILAAAKASHKNMWRYGDKDQDDANEFGMSAPRK